MHLLKDRYGRIYVDYGSTFNVSWNQDLTSDNSTESSSNKRQENHRNLHVVWVEVLHEQE